MALDGWLKQSTAVTVKIGPFVDDIDGKTAETALTIAQADVLLSKNGGTMAQKNDTNSCSHDALGYYSCSLSTTDTNTLGILKLMVSKSGALPVTQSYMVVPTNVWDSLFGADRLQVDVEEIGANIITSTAIATDAIGSTKVSAAAANKIADHVLRRSFANAIGSSDGDAIGFRSLLGAVAKLVNRIAVSGSTLTVYRHDDATALGTQTLTTTAGANPVTEMDTDG